LSKVLITTVPFGDKNRLPLEMLEDAGIDYLINPFNTKLSEDQLIELVSDVDVIVAGTEPITARVMDQASNLKMISRVGIGLDSVDLMAARERGIHVSHTADAPAPAVAEFTLGLMLSLLRSVHVSNTRMHNGHWERIFGRRLAEVTIGIIGVGRIGSRVLNRTKGFGTPRILVNDVMPNLDLDREFKLEWTSKEKIYHEADIISLHLPLTKKTHNMISKKHLLSMKRDAIIINTARGGIINEMDLYEVMKSGHLSGAAIDVFDQEPYDGPIKDIERCILTSHMGSMSIDCRVRMEIEATEEAIYFLSGRALKGSVPESEYLIQGEN